MTDRTEYMRKHRQTMTGQAQLAAQKRRDKARRRAVARLIDRYRLEWNAIFIEELDRVEEEFRAENSI